MGKSLNRMHGVLAEEAEADLRARFSVAGHLAVQYATAIGLRVVGIDTGDDKKKLLDQYGADAFIDFKNFRDEGALIKEVKRVCGGEGPHVSSSLISH